MSSRFIDEVEIEIRSGNGGAGCVSFRREKFVEFGGPDGGNGGHGGSVAVVADGQLGTLLDLRYRRRHFAENGRPGEGNQCSGRDGANCVVRVPIGTVVYNKDTGDELADLNTEGMAFRALAGGRGGKGNAHFKGPVRQAPRFAQPGEEGAGLKLRLELKLLADVGLIGFPNVGKSSLVARVSAARPKIADYPFTTLAPKLGVVRVGDFQSFVMADVPGLVVGAHQGHGLGCQFLRHVERVRRLVHLVTVEPDIDGRDPIADFEAISRELMLHAPELADVPQFIVLSRTDLPFVAEQIPVLQAYAAKQKLRFFPISTATGDGVQALVNALGEAVLADPNRGVLDRAFKDLAANRPEFSPPNR